MRFRKARLLYILIICSNAHANEWAFDAGIGATYLSIINSGEMNETATRPSLQIGLFKQNSEDWRIGTGLEWLAEKTDSWSNSTNILMWRLGDIDYRISDNFAVNLHGGYARFYREFPSYGYGIGAGAKYRVSETSYLAISMTTADVAVSANVPTENDTPRKNDLRWATVSFHILF